MSTLTIDGNSKPIQVLRPSTTYTVGVSGSSAASSAIVSGRVARIVSTVAVNYVINGTATSLSTYLPAEAVEYVHVYQGDTISFYSGTSGTAYVTEMV